MKLDRNENDDGLGKYAVINLRLLNDLCGHVGTFQRWTPGVEQALKTLEEVGALEWGKTGEANEFFLLKLKDRHSLPALQAYADSIQQTDPDFADEVKSLTLRAGPHSPFCKQPD